MKAFFFSCLLAIVAATGAMTGLATSAAAEFAADWTHSRFTPVTERAPTSRVTRTARAAQSDDGSRPQRSSAPQPQRASAPVTSTGGGQTGIASYYWQPQPVASGGRFNPNALTAAHKTLPFGTRVRVTRQDNGRSVDVVINDRGPYIAGRIIDLSRRAAQDIGMTGQGLARVSVSVIGR
jgi:rare lipoprotein A